MEPRPANWRTLRHGTLQSVGREARYQALMREEPEIVPPPQVIPDVPKGGRRRNTHAAQRHKVGCSSCEVCGWTPPVATVLHAHHVVPRSRGGSDDASNLAVLCPNHHALAHYVSPRGHTKGYYGPRTREALFERLLVLEADPAWYHAIYCGGHVTADEASRIQASAPVG